MSRTFHLLDRLKMTENTFMLLSAAVIGVVGGLGAVFFRYSIEFFQEAFTFISTVFSHQSLALFVIFFAVIWLCRWMSKQYIPDAAGHGVPEIIEAVNVRGGHIKGRVGIIETLLSALTIGCGGSCGSEGPIALIGSSFGSKIGQWVHVNAQRLKIFAACGAAAGIAATFNAPLGGFMFAVEIVLMDFGIAKVAPIVVSTIIASSTANQWFHDKPILDLTHRNLFHHNWILSVLILGIVIGLVSSLYILVLDKTKRLFDHPSFAKFNLLLVFVSALLFVTIVAVSPEVLGVGYETLSTLFTNNYSDISSMFTWQFLLILLFMKILATAITLGSGGSGGIFSPALFVGAIGGVFTGVSLSVMSPHFFEGIEPTTYGIIGMGAMVSGAMRAPITGFLITYELNRDSNTDLIMPLMLACVISTLVSRSFIRHSIFTLRLAQRGFLFSKGRDVYVTRQIKVEECYDKNYYSVPHHISAQALFKLAQTANHHSVFFVCDGIKLLGIIPMHQIRSLFNSSEKDISVKAIDLMSPAQPLLNKNDTLEFALKMFDRSQQEELAVVHDGNIEGVLTYTNAMSAYNKVLHNMTLTQDIADNLVLQDGDASIDLGDGNVLMEIVVPSSFVGKSLSELDLNKIYHIQVLMLKDHNQLKVKNVSATTRLQEKQIMMLLGPKDMINKIARL